MQEWRMEMNVRNCKKCGKIFNYVTGYPICPTCKAALEEKFHEVKQYIYDNEIATLKQVADNCGVDVNQIKQWVREERLTFSKDSMLGIECENCGATIRTGRFCDKCKNTMINNINSVVKANKPQESPKEDLKENPRMRYLDK